MVAIATPPFAVIPANIMLSKLLPAYERATWCALALFSAGPERPTAGPELSALAPVAGLSSDDVAASLKRLIEIGAIALQEEGSAAGRPGSADTYWLNFEFGQQEDGYQKFLDQRSGDRKLRMSERVEATYYTDPIVLTESSRFQRMVITRHQNDIRLFLEGHLQFSSLDEHRYHEALVHPAMVAAQKPKRVLILGGGDGFAVREVLKHESVEHIDLVDLDPLMTQVFSEHDFLVELNQGALSDSRLTIFSEDAMSFLEKSTETWDVILMDLPDPSEDILGKLYSTMFFELCEQKLCAGGALVTQATSPFRTRDAFWTIVRTVEAARFQPAPSSDEESNAQGFSVYPYRAFVPSFSAWGFVLATRAPLSVESLAVGVETRYVTTDMLPGLFVFPPDLDRRGSDVSTLEDPCVVGHFQDGYSDRFAG